jgi:hypothetical protein
LRGANALAYSESLLATIFCSKILDYAKNKLHWTNTLAYLALPSMTKKKITATKANHLKNLWFNISLCCKLEFFSALQYFFAIIKWSSLQKVCISTQKSFYEIDPMGLHFQYLHGCN